MKLKADQYNVSRTSGTEINVVPLLDVVFAILAFFILTSAGLVTQQAIGVDLPQSARSSNAQSGKMSMPEMLIVTLDNSGRTRISDREVSDASLSSEIQAFLGTYPQGLVVLNAETATVTYKQVIDKLEKLRSIAGNRVAIATSKS